MAEGVNRSRNSLCCWMVNIPISDYYIHGGKPSWIKPSYPHNKPYLEYKGIDPNYLQHLLVEYNVDLWSSPSHHSDNF